MQDGAHPRLGELLGHGVADGAGDDRVDGDPAAGRGSERAKVSASSDTSATTPPVVST